MPTLQLSTMKTSTRLLKASSRVARVADSSPHIQVRSAHRYALPTTSFPVHSLLGTRWNNPEMNSITPNLPFLQNIVSPFSRCKKHRGAPYSTNTAPPQGPIINSVFEKKTGTWQYVVADPSTNMAAIIDPVLDYDPVTQEVTTTSADLLLQLARERGYRIEWILETHAHADHLTAASYLQRQLYQEQGHRPSIGIGKRIDQVQILFGKRYGVPAKEYDFVFDKLFDDDEVFDIGGLKATAMHLPGHTPDHLGYRIGANVFCGDSVFHVDIGTARCDFPGGSVTQLWASTQRLFALPDSVKIWTGHDYPPDGRTEPVPCMSIKDHKEQNKHLKKGISEADFISMRTERDASLVAPRLVHQSLQVNIRGGKMPAPNESGLRLLHLPLKTKNEVVEA